MKDDIFEDVQKEWGDYLETENKVNTENFDTERYDFGDLLECYKEWKEEEVNKAFWDSYEIATKLLKKYEIPFLSENWINEFMDEWDKEYVCNGVFISAIINELYKNREIQLDFFNLSHIGCYNRDKKIVVEGDSREDTGSYMKGGEIVVKGDCEYGIGQGMEGGKIKVYGDNFNPKEQISIFAKKGEIYHKDELVWKAGKFVDDSRWNIKKILRYIKGDSI